MTNMGSCTISNTFSGEGQLMIDMRIKGKSWAEIANEMGLKSPSAARSRFTKLTGITDYKIKGMDLEYKLSNNLLDDLKQAAVKKADKVVKDLDGIVDDSISKFDPKSIEKDEAQVFFSTPKASVETKYTAVADNAAEKSAETIKKQQLAVSKKQYKTDALSNVVDKNIDDANKWEKVWETHKSGQGYSYIVKNTGLPFDEIDDFIWNKLVAENDGNIFKALASKKNSEKGVDFVKEKIANMKAKGWTDADIYEQWEFTKYDLDISNIATPIKPSPHQYQNYTPSSPSYNPPSYSYKAPTSHDYKVHYDEGGMPSYSRPAKSYLDDWHNRAPKMDPDSYREMKSYTGSSYHEINRSLRTGNINSSMQARIDAIDRGMLPAEKDMELIRHVGAEAFGNMDVSTLGGTVYSDPGYLSTSISDSVFRNTYRLELDVPAGTPGRWAQPFSNHPSEQEYILGRGIKWLVTKVEKKPGAGGYGFQWVIRMKAIG